MKYEIYRYDVRTHRRQIYDMRNMVSQGFRLSPDEHRIVFQRDGEGIYIGDLRTGRVTRVYSTGKSILNLYWPSSDTIVFSERSSGQGDSIFILDPTSRSVKRFPSGCHLEFSACDGSGFLYIDKANRYRLHTLDGGVDRVVSFGHGSHTGDLHFLYLDKEKVIYSVWGLEYQYTAIVDLRTMRMRRMSLPDPRQDMRLSPDLERYWYSGPYHTDKESIKLYSVDIPPKVVEQLRAPVN